MNTKKVWTGILAITAMTVLILDSKTALQGAKAGMELCFYTVVPSLFPFLVFSALINSVFTGRSLPFLRPISRLCGIPEGCESLLILGLIGGYPVGAQAVSDAYKQNILSSRTAKRMLGFCNNAGPSFLFGMVAAFFSSVCVPWLLWLIQIVSAVIVGALLPGKEHSKASLPTEKPITLPQSLNSALRAMASICGWVVLFRVILAVCARWFLWLLPPLAQITFTGVIELSNGCCALGSVENEGVRFLLASGLLSFGGLCVCMQTFSVVSELGPGMHVPGKLLQSAVSLLLAALMQPLLFTDGRILYGVLVGALATVVIIVLILQKSSGKLAVHGV